MDLVNWRLLAQKLKNNRSLMIRNDSGLAKALGVAQQSVSKWQNSPVGSENPDLPFRAKIRMLELGGYERIKAFLLMGQSQDKINKIEQKNRQIEVAWLESLPEDEPLPNESELFLCDFSVVEDLLEAVKPADGSESKLKLKK
jgi:hypothetical protein